MKIKLFKVFGTLIFVFASDVKTKFDCNNAIVN